MQTVSLSRITTTSTSATSTLEKRKEKSDDNNATSSDEQREASSKNNETAFDTSPCSSGDVSNCIQKDNNDQVDSILSDISSWMKDHQSRYAAACQGNEDSLFDDHDDYNQQHQKKQHPQILRRPFITLAYAQTLDGMIAAKLKSSNSNKTGSLTTSNMKISSHQSLILTHKLRTMHDAILVGGATFALDEPRLNARLPEISSSLQQQQQLQPLPIVLDTHLRHLQQILFDMTFPIGSSTWLEKLEDDEEDIETATTVTIPSEISVERIRARSPIICCSKQAAFSFLNFLEIFQDQHVLRQQRKRSKSKRSYKIVVYKKIDENDHIDDAFMPIKITIYVMTHHNNKKKEGEESVTSCEVTFTILPCPLNDQTHSISLKHAMDQLCDQFEIKSVLVEGGAGVLSSFLNESDYDDGGKIVHCVCVTIAPTLLGGGIGLPSLCGLDATLSDNGDHEDDDKDVPVMRSIDGKFIPLDRDCIFLGRL